MVASPRPRADWLPALSFALSGVLLASPAVAQQATPATGPITLEPCTIGSNSVVARCGVHRVFENREARSGRTLPLRIVVLPARQPRAGADPVYHLVGGPGQAATESAANLVDSWLRDEHEIVLLDQRGTGAGHQLDCTTAESEEDPRQFLEPLFTVTRFEACRRRLEQAADLRFYTTPFAAEDLDEVRRGLGHDRINLHGGSYGTRFALVYMRAHPERVRSAILRSAVPLAFRNPLHHARAAQDALDGLIGDCEKDAACNAAFPRIRTELAAITARLRAAPAQLTVTGPGSRPAPVALTLETFAEAIRTMMYRSERGARVPLLIHQAWDGDFEPFAEAAITSNRGVRGSIRSGMLQSVVCSEDGARISEAEIVQETQGTLLGDSRVRQQLAACAVWPRTELPTDYAEPVRVSIPTLILSGSRDPVTPPQWGTEAARHLPRSLHLIVAGGHTPASPCLNAISAEFLQRGAPEGLDLNCLAAERYPPFVLP